MRLPYTYIKSLKQLFCSRVTSSWFHLWYRNISSTVFLFYFDILYNPSINSSPSSYHNLFAFRYLGICPRKAPVCPVHYHILFVSHRIVFKTDLADIYNLRSKNVSNVFCIFSFASGYLTNYLNEGNGKGRRFLCYTLGIIAIRASLKWTYIRKPSIL